MSTLDRRTTLALYLREVERVLSDFEKSLAHRVGQDLLETARGERTAEATTSRPTPAPSRSLAR